MNLNLKQLKYVILFISALVRVPFLFRDLRYDEAYTYLYYATQNLAGIISDYSYPNNHVFHTLLVKISTSLFNNSEIFIRLPAFIFGVLITLLLYEITNILINERAAVVAAILSALHPSLINYSALARGYIIEVALFLLSFWLLLKLSKINNFLWWIFYSVTIALSLYTIPTSVYFVVLLIVFFFFYSEDSDFRFRLISYTVMGILLSVIFYMPIIERWGVEKLVANKYVKSLPFGEWFFIFPSYLRETSEFIFVSPIIMFIFLVAMVVSFSRLERRFITLMISGFLLIWLVFPFIQRVLPYARVMIILVPVSIILFSYVLDRLESVLLRAVFVLPVIFIFVMHIPSIWYSKETGSFVEARKTAQYILKIAKPYDYVLTALPSGTPLEYYIYREKPMMRVIMHPRKGIRRFIIVVDHHQGQTLEKVIKPVKKLIRSRPHLVKKFKYTEIYIYNLTRVRK